MKHIDFFLIGVQKSATTWLYHCLQDHPSIYIGGQKVEKKYLGGPEHKEGGIEWEDALFRQAFPDQKKGSCSVDYFYDLESVQYIKQNNSSPHLILSLRNPLDRLVSAYHWMRRNNELTDESLTYCLEKGLDRLQKKMESDVYTQLIERSLYYAPLQRYIETLPEAPFFIVFYDEIKKFPLEVCRSLYHFLGVDSNFKPRSLYRIPKGNAGIPFLQEVEKVLSDNRVFRKMFRGVNEIIRIAKPDSQQDTVRPQLPVDLQEELSLLFIHDLEKVEKLCIKNHFNLLKENSLSILRKWKTDMLDNK